LQELHIHMLVLELRNRMPKLLVHIHRTSSLELHMESLALRFDKSHSPWSLLS
jgi:hypothetical protein